MQVRIYFQGYYPYLHSFEIYPNLHYSLTEIRTNENKLGHRLFFWRKKASGYRTLPLKSGLYKKMFFFKKLEKPISANNYDDDPGPG